jgi:T3SS negative regulator,GrlR
MAPLDAHRRGLYPLARRDAVSSMKNGLYSVHIHMLDGVKGRDSGILVLRDGVLIGGGPYFWSVGSYSVGDGTWKGELRTNQHTPFADPFVRPLFGGQEVTSGFSGTFAEDQAEVFGTTLVGTKSLSFRATLKKLADD